MEKNEIENWKSHAIVDLERMGINQTLFVENPDIKVLLVEVIGSVRNPDIPDGISSILLIINTP
ncbi:hypothetical protein X975_19435, partial [Stegodyphus mimosarum]